MRAMQASISLWMTAQFVAFEAIKAQFFTKAAWFLSAIALFFCATLWKLKTFEFPFKAFIVCKKISNGLAARAGAIAFKCHCLQRSEEQLLAARNTYRNPVLY